MILDTYGRNFIGHRDSRYRLYVVHAVGFSPSKDRRDRV